MNFIEIKKWGKSQGFDIIKEKDDSVNGASYYWAKISNIDITGVSLSVSKLARDLYNNVTDNKWLEHQLNYQEKLSNKDINRDKFWN